MTEIYVDADGCPVKEETLKVARRHKLKTYLVSDGGVRPSRDPLVEVVFVAEGPDAADDWIAEHIGPGDVCVTNDIPLAARCLAAGSHAIKANGERFTQAGIGMALAQRDLMQHLREAGEVTGGPRAFSKADRSAFLNQLDATLRAARQGRPA